MLIVFNQNAQNQVNTTLRVPLYYAGLDATASVLMGAVGSPPQGTAKTIPIERDWSITLNVMMPPSSVMYWSFE